MGIKHQKSNIKMGSQTPFIALGVSITYQDAKFSSLLFEFLILFFAVL